MCSTVVEDLPEECRKDLVRIQDRILELKNGEVPAAVGSSSIKHVLLTGATRYITNRNSQAGTYFVKIGVFCYCAPLSLAVLLSVKVDILVFIAI